jgi:hypothetical protein
MAHEHLTDEQLGVETRRILHLKLGSQSRISQLLGLGNCCFPPTSSTAPAPKAKAKAGPVDRGGNPIVKEEAAASGDGDASDPTVKKVTKKKASKKKAVAKKEY